MMERIEAWLEKRYGRLLTREEMRARYDDTPIDWKAAWNPPRQFPKGYVREYDPTGVRTYVR